MFRRQVVTSPVASSAPKGAWSTPKVASGGATTESPVTTTSDSNSKDDSDEEDDHFQDAVDMDEYSTYAPPSPNERRRTPSFLSGGSARLSKKQIAQLKADATDEKILEDIVEVEASLEMFLNSQFRDAEASLIPKYGRSLYFTEGVALLRTLRAVMTFDPDDMSLALESLSYAAEKERVAYFGMLSGAANAVTGSKDPNYLNGMTRVQKHAELVYAECSCMQSLLTLISNTNLVNFVKEGMQLRSAFAIIKAAFKFLETIYEEEGVDGYSNHFIDEHFTSGVIMNAGLFTLVLSFLPTKIIKVFELMGFQGDRDVALDRLSTAAEWPFTPSIFVTGNLKSKFKTCFPAPPHKTGTSGGLRKSFAEIILFAYHIILASLNPLPDCNLPLAGDNLAKCLERRDRSFIFRAMRARMLETEAKPAEAEAEYKVVISLQRDYQQLYHACLWDMGLCQMAQRKWSAAYEGYTVLYSESKWTRAVYRYVQACTLYSQTKEDPRVTEMMKEVPGLLKKIAGISVPIEKFVSRKSRKFLSQGNRLLFPAYEILYFFHGLVMMSKETLSLVVQETTLVLKDLADLKSSTTTTTTTTTSNESLPYSTYYDDVCLALFIRAVAEREMGFPTVNTLSEIKNQVLMGRAYNSMLTIPSSTTTATTTTTTTKKQASGTTTKGPLPSAEAVSYLNDSITSFKKLIAESQKIELDHWMLLFGRYELGSLYLRVGEFDLARKEFDAAQNKGVAEGEGSEVQGVKKASLENMLQVRCHNALLKLKALEETSKMIP
ncbi:hypothetical protein BDR26DRAFT_864962 [Obelidium mucronatum]|nr:hypothetical protein BDR26DRAFT_864962 [Obelidium mucronatum]